MKVASGLWIEESKPEKEKEPDRDFPVAHYTGDIRVYLNQVECSILLDALRMYQGYYASELKEPDFKLTQRIERKLESIVSKNPL